MVNDKYRLFIFDWDGTIVDSVARIVDAFEHAAHSFGLVGACRERIATSIGLDIAVMIEHAYGTVDSVTADEFRQRYRRRWQENASIGMPVFDGAGRCLTDLDAAGGTLAVATGKSRNGLSQALDETGYSERFAFTRTADESFGKPNPQMLFDILEFTNTEHHEALMIGDTSFDMQMAANAGMAAVGVLFGVHSEKDLLDAGAVATFSDFHALRPWLLRRTA